MKAEDMFKELGYECKYSKQRISYAKTVYRTTTLIVFDLKTKQAYCECGMGLRVFSHEESKAVQQQKKELGWLEEEKAETNYEHYKDVILEDSGLTLALVGGKPCKCISVHCSDCEFSTGHGCSEKMKEWLDSTYEKTKYKLNKFEYDLIQTYSDCRDECKFCDFMQLNKLKNMGYFSCIDSSIKISDILRNCEIHDDEIQ